MSHNGYTVLSQGANDEVEKDGLLSYPDNYAPMTSVEITRHRIMSMRRIVIALTVLLLINATCLIVTMQHLQLVSRVLKPYLNFVDNRDLPRPDPYDGL
ncbi:hypothetical protein BS17DRAFT_781060 [Gyrodon lividus]|nr:hypothetical protein BS17DRAFT_781060 [Gyrodon lividus]